jgi:hypothetical protein
MARYNTAPQTLIVTGATTFSYAFTGGIISLTGSPGYTVTLVSPVFFPGSRQTFYNATSDMIMLETAAGMFKGNGVALGMEIAIPTNSTYTLTSDGADYVLTSALAGTTVFELPVTFNDLLNADGPVELNPANHDVQISPTGSGVVDISPAGNVQFQGTGALTVNVSQAVSIGSVGSTVSLGNAGRTTSILGNISAATTDQTVTLSPTGSGTVTINPTGNLSLNSGGSVSITSTSAGSITNMNIGISNPGSGAFTSLTASGNATMTSSTASTGVASGALVVTGGLGVGGAIYAGSIQETPIGSTTRSSGAFTSISANAASNITASTASTNTTTGALVVTGGLGVGGAIHAGSLQNTAVGSTSRSTGAFTTLTANAATTLTANTASTTTTTGSLVVTGGVGVSGQVTATTLSGNHTGGSGSFTTLASSSNATFSGNTSVAGTSTFSVGTGAATFGGSVQINGSSVNASSAYTPSSAYNLMTKTYTELKYGKDWVLQSANTTATSGSRYFVDTTSSARTITLPASPSRGDWVQFVDYGGTFNARALTVARNSQNIMGIADNMTVSTQGAAFTLVFSGNATYGWRMAGGI